MPSSPLQSLHPRYFGFHHRVHFFQWMPNDNGAWWGWLLVKMLRTMTSATRKLTNRMPMEHNTRRIDCPIERCPNEKRKFQRFHIPVVSIWSCPIIGSSWVMLSKTGILFIIGSSFIQSAWIEIQWSNRLIFSSSPNIKPFQWMRYN